MKIKRMMRQLALLALLLVTGFSPAWAGWTIEGTNYQDSSGGLYTFRSDNRSNFSDPLFSTEERFSLEASQLFSQFTLRVCGPSFKLLDCDVDGSVYVVTSDDVRHTISSWKKGEGKDDVKLTASTGTEDFGVVTFVASDGALRTFTMRYTPSGNAFAQGVKKIGFAGRFLVNYGIDFSANYEYEKDIDLASMVTAEKPLPRLSIDWADDGLLSYTAQNVPDWRSNSCIQSQEYITRRYYMISNDATRFANLTTGTGNTEVTAEHGDGTVDIHFTTVVRTSSGTSSAYFYPVFVKYWRESVYSPDDDNSQKISIEQPEEIVTIAPFTCPTSIHVVFDKWTKRNTVSWTRTTSAQGYGYEGWKRVDCRTDGTWYLVRYDQGHDASDYTVVGTLPGDSPTLQCVDSDFEYEKEYVYRVIFLPDMLKDAYAERLTDGIVGSKDRLMANFWQEEEVSTKLDMPIRLTQDRSYDQKVRLVWEYCIQPSGQNWTIEYSPAGENAWRVLDSSMMVDPERSTASFDAEGSVCDLMDYRIKTTYADKDFYSNVYTGNLPAGSYISEVKASTGTEEKTVIVKWKVARADMNNDIWFRVLRRAVGTEEWTTLTDEIHGTSSEYSYVDDRPLAGSYYEYSVQAFGAKCDEQLVRTDEVVTPGFSQARGTITGHISYGTGTAVAGARVNLIKSSAETDADQPQYLSRLIEGEGKGLQWTADSAKYANVLNGDKEMTIQLWAKPTGNGDDAMLLRLENALEIGITRGQDDQACLYAYDLSDGQKQKVFGNLVFDKQEFTHVAAAYRAGTWTFYVGCDTLREGVMTVESTTWNACDTKKTQLRIGGSARIVRNAFNGYVDDIRLWKRSLTKEEVATNYTRILAGTEDGLMLYWPLDEGIGVKDYAFDVACQDGIYQLNHPEVGVNAIPSAHVPRQLALFGITDAEGDYIIQGIPFQQGGTNYKLAPELGIHEFSPNTRSMFVSPTSLTANNIDFEDVSSFPMEGHVYYAGTNIPAEGIQFYVDGQLLTTDGVVQQTDAEGRYRISVPIGEHFVEAKLGNHKMVNQGRFPTEGKYNFTGPTTYDFADSTLVNFVGRIGGGERNDTLAVGFGASRNNIGQAIITLKLNNESLSFNVQDYRTPAAATTVRTWASDTTAIRSTAWTGTGGDSKLIKIMTDAQTGEFSALLPPLKYITKSIEIVHNEEGIEFSTLPQIDLSNVLREQTDSLWQTDEQGDSVLNQYKYHTKMVQTYFAQPELEISEPGSPFGAFGMKEFEGEDELGSFTVSDLWRRDADGSVSYRYGYPIYNMGDEYRLSVFGYETYTNYDTAVTDTIPLAGKVVTVSNEMSADQTIVAVVPPGETEFQLGQVYDLKKNELVLDSLGCYTFKWNAGAPNVVSPYTRHLSMSIDRAGRKYVPVSMDAIVVGNLPIGNNFVTNGPDKVLMVLRDPPGSKSKTVWKTGSTMTKMKTVADGGFGSEKITIEQNLGVRIKFMSGFGLYYQTTDIDNTMDMAAACTILGRAAPRMSRRGP